MLVPSSKTRVGTYLHGTQVYHCRQLKMIKDEMDRLKKEIYSENGGLAGIQVKLT